MSQTRLYVFDLDGTLYRGSEVVPHAPEVVGSLVGRGMIVRYITNNSAARPEAITGKLRGMGFACEPEWVYGTGPAAARLVVERGVSAAYVVGEPTLVQTCREAGLETIDEERAVQGEAQAVVVGICRHFSYAMLRAAQRAIVQGAIFVATNRDATYPVEGGLEDPGSGSIVAAVEVASGQSPVVVGKPSPHMLFDILRDTNCSSNECLVIGDRVDTDIGAGVAAGCPTFLVLTGVTRELPPGQPGADNLRGLL
ncbi:MAG: HAD-IIA family hydrolase [Armatimonadetes bacterium]|nr:HAD-IIA family hydrolase [Armatimonadota bacterium]